MIVDSEPYPQYRVAEAPWLGEIPAHWSVRRMKYVVKELDSRSTTGEEQLLSVSQYTGVTPRRRSDDSEEPNTRANSLVGYKHVARADLVVNIMLAWNGSMGVSHHAGIASPAYCVYRFGANLNPWYFHNLLRSPSYKARIKATSTGVVESRLRLYSDDLFRIEALLPPPAEQDAIVRFLNYASGKLEAAISAKRRVIALLNEQKQAIIHRATTHGLDFSVPLTPSGIPWVGNIPQHWEVRRLKTLLERNDGGVWGKDFDPSGTIVLRSTEQTVDGAWRVNDPAVIRLTDAQVRSALLEAGDIVVTKSSGSPTHIGKASLVTNEIAKMHCCYSNFMQRLRPAPALMAEYLELFLNCSTGRMHYQYSATSTTGLGNLTRETIATLPIPFPPRSEQASILRALDAELTPIKATAGRLEHEIELLREYRTRLVADVVTGKLDVREAAARLPEDATADTTENEADLGDETDPADEEAGEDGRLSTAS